MVFVLAPVFEAAAQVPENSGAEEPSAVVGERQPGNSSRWAVIIEGLPGDSDHRKLFRKTADAWQGWLVDSLGFPAEQVIRFPEAAAVEAEASAEITADDVRVRLNTLRDTLKPDDAFWLLTLGHGSYDGKRAWFHMAGRDPSEADFAAWLAGFRCKEQVLWLSHSSSGWMIKALSRPGRIVITATAADDESNETEFPHALAAVGRKSPATLDLDKDGRLTVVELYTAVAAEVERRFKLDNRLATEHAQLDDNGDAKGTEKPGELPAAGELLPGQGLVLEVTPKGDGLLAARTVVPDVRLAKKPEAPAEP